MVDLVGNASYIFVCITDSSKYQLRFNEIFVNMKFSFNKDKNINDKI